MDPLTLLRDYNIKGQLESVVTRGDRIEFGDSFSFPKSFHTAYKSRKGDFYDLETVLFFLQSLKQGQKLGAYIKAAQAQKIKPVAFVDRQVGSGSSATVCFSRFSNTGVKLDAYSTLKTRQYRPGSGLRSLSDRQDRHVRVHPACGSGAGTSRALHRASRGAQRALCRELGGTSLPS
jgi:Paf1 complex subunit CDC73 N-terminal